MSSNSVTSPVVGSVAPQIGVDIPLHDVSKGPEEAVDEKPRIDSTSTKGLESGSGNSDDAVHRAALDPLHNTSSDGVIYKSMSWWHCGLLMIAETISLGILSLPYAVAQLGLVPGVLSIFGLGVLATYSGYVIGQFKMHYPNVLSMADAGFVLFGTVGYHVFSWAALLSFIFIMAAHILTFSVAMNVLTNHAICSVYWALIGTVISIIITLPRTLKNISYYSILSCISIAVAVFVLMISVGIDHDAGDRGTAFRNHYTFSPTILAILNITIAYMGNVAFFGFISELRRPHDFTKALFLLQGCTISFYIMVGVVIYCYVGPSVVSPALGSTTPTIQKVAYGIALITIIVAGVVNAHVACKQLYVQFWRRFNPAVVTSKSFKARGSWVLIVCVSWLVAMVLALAIPIFNEMLGLISALFGAWFTYGVCGMFWLKMNWHSLTRLYCKYQLGPPVGSTCAMLALNIGMIAIGAVMCGLGLYVTSTDLANLKVGKPFSCASNAP